MAGRRGYSPRLVTVQLAAAVNRLPGVTIVRIIPRHRGGAWSAPRSAFLLVRFVDREEHWSFDHARRAVACEATMQAEGRHCSNLSEHASRSVV